MRRNNHAPVGQQVPILGQAPSREQQAQVALRQMIGQMSAGIYQSLAVAHISGLDVHQDVSRQTLRDIAKKSQMAATAYFEGLGIIEPQ